MARPKRIDLPHSLYHVMSRTNTGEICFNDERDMRKFYKYLSKYCRLLDFKVHAYCLMPTHYHLLLESGQNPALSDFMLRLLTAYIVYFNKKHGRRGHLFQGRFKSFIIEKSDYFIAVSRYIHLNPVKGEDVARAEKYPGSSLHYYLKGGEPDFLETKEILSWFDGDRKAYGKFVREGLNEDTKPGIIQQRFIGGSKFAERINKRLKLMKKSGSRSDQARIIIKKANEERQAAKAGKILEKVAEYFDVEKTNITDKTRAHGRSKKAKSALIILLREKVAWDYNEIAEFAGLKNKNSIPYHLKKIETDEEIERAVADIERGPKFV